MAVDHLVFLRQGPCERCRELGDVRQELAETRRLAEDRALEIHRLQAQIEAVTRRRHRSDGGTSIGVALSPDRRAQRQLFGAVSIADVPRGEDAPRAGAAAPGRSGTVRSDR
jgi:hypothetical protein